MCLRTKPTMLSRRDVLIALVCLTVAIAGFTGPVEAQTFSSGSTGVDGALDISNPAAPTVIQFDPSTFNPPLDPDRDGVYHFTTINVPANVTLRFRADKAGFAPIYWLATSAVVIDGALDLNGDDGLAGTTAPGSRALPGPGGFPGGIGAVLPHISAQAGLGPGGGCTAPGDFGRGAGHATAAAVTNCGGGAAYGNPFLLPLIGGSGGGGASITNGLNNSGGGAGGGAILIASSVGILLRGRISANGGGSPTQYNGGAGSGGAIRLVAPALDGNGSISAARGANSNGDTVAAHGRVRLETGQNQNHFTGTIAGDGRLATLTPNVIILPTTPQPSIRVTKVGSQTVSANPSGLFDPVDVTITSAQDVEIDLAAKNVPLGTPIEVLVVNETEGTISGTSSGLAGSLATSTANVTMRLPAGFSRIYTRAKWTP